MPKSIRLESCVFGWGTALAARLTPSGYAVVDIDFDDGCQRSILMLPEYWLSDAAELEKVFGELQNQVA